jgi:ribosome-binding factor A
MNNTGVSRPDRVAEEIRRTLSELLIKEVKDPRLQMVNITDCKVTRDLGIAKVYFTYIGKNESDPEVEAAKAALEKAKGFFRSEIGKQMKLRIVPEVRFYYDNAAENASHIEALIFEALHKKK